MRNMSKRVFAAISAIAMIFSASCFTSCEKDPIEGTGQNVTQGVVLPTVKTISVSAMGGNYSVAFEAKDSFTIEKEDPNNIIQSITLVGTPKPTEGAAGKHSLRLKFDKNTAENALSAKIYITVKGYVRTKLVDITQQTKFNDMDEVVKWMDERLRGEYYWLDEYNDKWQNFEFKVVRKDQDSYNKLLETNLFKMATNQMDGGTNSNGRYIYTNVQMIPANEYSSTRAGGEVRYGYGFDILPIVIQIEGGETETRNDDFYAFPVDHVYPNSSAATSGLRRSDLITMVAGNTITASNYASVYSTLATQSSSSLRLEKEDFASGEKATINVSRSQFNANPVAYVGVLGPAGTEDKDVEAWAEINPSGKKIGYISYLSFDHKGDDKLLDAFRTLASKGVEDVIVDLRSNGGGAVSSAVKMSSMLVGEEHVGEVCAKLMRNPKNNLYEPENLNTIYKFRKYEESNESGADLPNLNMMKAYFIVSEYTASASEMVIMALRGVDVETELIGTRTEGKNCGMDVIDKQIGQYYYSFAPITFLNYNAKDFCEYSDGIKPDADFTELYAIYTNRYKANPEGESEEDAALRKSLDWYPIPESPWGNVYNDLALKEAVKRINGTTLFNTGENTRSSEAATTFAPAKAARTFGEMIPLQRISTPHRPLGALVTEEDRQMLAEIEAME